MSGDIQASPFHRRDHSLAGFIVSGRWPDSTREWAQFLALAVRITAVPGMVLDTAVFRAIEEVPDDPQPGTIGLVTDEGPVLADNGPKPGDFVYPQPPALMVLHPPTHSLHSSGESANAASGCVLLPGIPHLGLEHRAAWVEAEADGTVTRLVSATGVDPMSDPDLAVLVSLCAAA